MRISSLELRPRERQFEAIELVYVRDVDLMERGLACLIGGRDPAFGVLSVDVLQGIHENTETGPFELHDDHDLVVLYLTGVQPGRDMVLGFKPLRGAAPMIERVTGLSLVLEHGVFVHDDPEGIDPKHPLAEDYEYRGCAAWRLAWALKRGRLSVKPAIKELTVLKRRHTEYAFVVRTGEELVTVIGGRAGARQLRPELAGEEADYLLQTGFEVVSADTKENIK